MAGDTEKDAMTDRELAKELRAKLNVTDNDAVMLQLYPYLSGLAAPEPEKKDA